MAHVPPPRPLDEEKRLRTLGLYGVLDTGREQALDDLVQLVSMICETPVALISLVDRDRQWFKSNVGLEGVTETPREVSFCGYTILDDGVFEVEDATLDPRFADNPLVTSDPKIRFYAGMPLSVEDGSALGSLCVIDHKPRKLNEFQRKALAALRGAILNHLELNRVLASYEDLGKVVSMCGYCHAVKQADGSYISLHDYVNGLETVSHGICEACARRERTTY